MVGVEVFNRLHHELIGVVSSLAVVDVKTQAFKNKAAQVMGGASRASAPGCDSSSVLTSSLPRTKS